LKALIHVRIFLEADLLVIKGFQSIKIVEGLKYSLIFSLLEGFIPRTVLAMLCFGPRQRLLSLVGLELRVWSWRDFRRVLE
jgi:hypothetical protein